MVTGVWTWEDIWPVSLMAFSALVVLVSLAELVILVAAVFTGFALVGAAALARMHAHRRARILARLMSL
jgi:hypothetical protein